MLMETCRYRVVDGKVETKMFGMRGNDWDIEPGWHHDPKAAKAAAASPKTTIISATAELVEDKPVKISRFAKKLADELGIDVSKVTGTGADGGITKDDVTKYYNEAEVDGHSTGSD